MTTTPQSHQIMSALATNVDWSKVRFEDANLQEAIIRNPERAAEQFMKFLNNGAKLIIGEPKFIDVNRSKPFNPAFIGNGWTIWKGPIDGKGLEGEEEQDARSLALARVDLTQIRLQSPLKSGEKTVKGETKLARLKEAGHVRLDAQVFQTLWENQDLIPPQWKEKTNGNTTYIFFDGTVLRRSGGGRCVLCLYWLGGQWYWGCRWLERGFRAIGPSAVLASES
jgi:hypothetical protein